MSDEIAWDDNDTPVAKRFDDPYFSKRDGRAESNHVFVKGNGLPDRWQNEVDFHIAELGFGTGLNFLQTVLMWRTGTKQQGTLTYTSFERFPMSISEQRRALNRWPDLLPLMEEFLPEMRAQNGVHSVSSGSVTLRLLIGDANERVHELKPPADAWYLDGFSPDKNPELWNLDLMKAVASKTAPGGTFATYTAAGWVRRMLADVGFEVERIKGFGTKRHMTVGRLPLQAARENEELY